MSREMNNFASHFMRGLALGAGWAEKWQAQAIAKERNKLIAQRQALQDARETKKLGLYEQNVMADVELKKARAFRQMNPVAKGGRGGGGVTQTSNADVDGLLREATQRGIIATPPAAPAALTSNTTIIEGSEGDIPSASEPPASETIQYERRGGRVQKMAGGGSVEDGADMSIEEAMAYARKKSGGDAGSSFGGALGTAAGKFAGRAATGKAPVNFDTPADGVGTGTGITYAQGGVVPDLTAPLNVQVQAMPPPPDPRYANVFDYGSANGGTGSSGDAGGGVSGGTGGVGGSATDGSGGSAAAGVGGDDGGTYNRGGRVRQYQSGGRVLRAIDTGMSGPGTGFGQQAAPPSRRY